MPSDRSLKTMNSIHRGLLRISRGRLGWMAAGMPVLGLTTIGRKSGRPRSVMLTSPHQEDDMLVVIASKGGEETHPAWFLNLRDNPEVVVTMKGAPERKMIARVASTKERERLWPIVTGNHPNYSDYQKRTHREIPVVILRPAD